MSNSLVEIGCTDRGQHSWTALGDLGVAADGTIMLNSGSGGNRAFAQGKGPAVWAEPDYSTGAGRAPRLRDMSRVRVQARCPRCGEHEQWRDATWRDILQKLAAAGLARLDVSWL